MKKYPFLLQHQSHVWISDTLTLQQEAIKSLCEVFCQNNACGNCLVCLKIQQRQHTSVFWIIPEEQYTLDDIDSILNAVKFKLTHNECRFFIIAHAEKLTLACSNRLLKTIEEPHFGYYFLFLSSRLDMIIPTILSRSFFREFPYVIQSHEYQEIMQPFIDQCFDKPVDFLKVFDKIDVKELESRDILDLLMQYFYDQLKNIYSQTVKSPEQIMKYMNYIVLLRKQYNQLPVQGSSKMFWKNIYLLFQVESLSLPINKSSLDLA